jgi:hypothetical protein
MVRTGVVTLVAVIVRSKLMPAPSPVTFGFAELSPVTEPVILPVPRLLALKHRGEQEEEPQGAETFHKLKSSCNPTDGQRSRSHWHLLNYVSMPVQYGCTRIAGCFWRGPDYHLPDTAIHGTGADSALPSITFRENEPDQQAVE